ncbi:MAG TPA: hypothetical protein VIJ35_10305 [Bradyrhizobium sp.]
MLNDFEGRVVDRRQPRAKFGPGPAFDAGDQNTQHVVENLDLILVEALPAMQEEICHPAKRRNPSFRRAAPDGVFEFGDDGMIQLLHDSPMFLLRYLAGAEPGSGKPGKPREFAQR